MAWNWILTLAPAADDIIKMVVAKVNTKKKKDELTKEISNKFISLYTQSIIDVKSDVAIVASWKSYIAPIQAMQTVMRSWRLAIDLANIAKKPELALKVLSVKNIESLSKDAAKLSKTIRDITVQHNISWRDSGVDIISQFDGIKSDLTLLIKQTNRIEADVKAKKAVTIDDFAPIEGEINDIEQKILVILNYWDAFLQDLVANMAKAPKVFVKGAVGLTEIAINTKYDDTKWEDIFEKTYKALESTPAVQTPTSPK